MSNITKIINEEIISFNEGESNTDIILYHGTNGDFNEFNINKSGLIKYSDWGGGIYFTTSKYSAGQYAVDAVKYSNDDYNNAYNDYVESNKKLKSFEFDTPEYNNQYNLIDSNLKKFQAIGKELNSTKEGRIIMAKLKPNAKIYKFNSVDGITDPYLAEKVKSKGFNVILIDEGRYTEEYVVLDTNVIDIIGDVKD